MQKIRKNDEVIVIAGRDKGNRGEVIRVLDNGKLLVSGINLVKKHERPNPNAGVQGGIIEREAPIQASNVALYNPESGKADRVAIKVVDGDKIRVFKSNDAPVDA